MYISIIIPTYNSKNTLKSTLESLYIQNHRNFEVIVIDNGSEDGTYEFIKNTFPWIKIIKNNKNLGSCVARNQGINIAKGEYIMFMDSDVELEKNFFSKLEKILKIIPKNIVAISPKIINKNTNKIFSCGLYISPIYRVYDIGKGKNPKKFSYSFKIDGPNSCCAIFRKDFVEERKNKEKYFFDNEFFFLFEDADIALYLKKSKHLSFFIPDIVCYHKGNSSNFSYVFRRYLCFRNRWYMIIKYHRNPFVFFLFRSPHYDLIRTLHFMVTNRYSFVAFKEIWKKIKALDKI
jgi:hypothetical protein